MKLTQEALTRLIKSVKQNHAALRNAVQDEVVYGVLLYNELINSRSALSQRIQEALEQVVRLKSIMEIQLVLLTTDTVEVNNRSCGHCPLPISHYLKASNRQ
ncbi:hypothetical protein [Scytonema sp. UIC 10036]|uniref:hypothetical protein n=1 Tax=Scytonema sp. UIC 10036 TaxID=2304196 RepID=UPI001FAA2FCD|nr:hypothetical protein [Scytonema sp. UIC 10036]